VDFELYFQSNTDYELYEISGEEYWEEYQSMTKIRDLIERNKDKKSDENLILSIFKPLIETFAIAFSILFAFLLICCLYCVITTCDCSQWCNAFIHLI
jgi:hypothetical protein